VSKGEQGMSQSEQKRRGVTWALVGCSRLDSSHIIENILVHNITALNMKSHTLYYLFESINTLSRDKKYVYGLTGPPFWFKYSRPKSESLMKTRQGPKLGLTAISQN